MKKKKIDFKTVHTLSGLADALDIPWDASHILKINEDVYVGLFDDTFYVKLPDTTWDTAVQVKPSEIVSYIHTNYLKEKK